MNTITCIGCGCDDENACAGDCHWLRIDQHHQLGVCSECPEDVARFDAGDREPTPQAFEAVAVRIEAETADEAPALILPGDDEFTSTLRDLRSR